MFAKSATIAIYVILILSVLFGFDFRTLLIGGFTLLSGIQWLRGGDMAFALFVALGLLAYVICILGLFLKKQFGELERAQFKYILIVSVCWLVLQIIAQMILYFEYAHVVGVGLNFAQAFILFVGLNAYLHARNVRWASLFNEIGLACRLR